MRPSDAVAAAQIHAEHFGRPWGVAEIEGMVADRACVGHVARTGGWRPRTDGFVISRVAADEAEILTIAVRRARHGQGIAQQLLLHHLGGLVPHGARSLFLEVDENNAPALALYRRAGFTRVGERKSYYRLADGSTANALILRRSLG